MLNIEEMDEHNLLCSDSYNESSESFARANHKLLHDSANVSYSVVLKSTVPDSICELGPGARL